MKRVLTIAILLICAVSTIVFAAGQQEAGGKDVTTIGVAMGDLRLERWQRDVFYMEEAAAASGVRVIVKSADGDENLQLNQIETMLTNGIDVLLIMPVSSKTMSGAVDACHEDGVKIISYDRMIENADLDYFVTFDTIGVGEMQASALLEVVPSGKWFIMTGNEDDSNGQLFEVGQRNIIQPLIDNGTIEIVGRQNALGWQAETALPLMEDALTANNNDIDAVLCANDGMAAGVIEALAAQGLAGKVPVTGQDADLIACQHIAEGTQYMTVYKPLNKLAYAAIDFATKVANGEDVMSYCNKTNNNGKVDVPTYALDLVLTTKDTLMDTVIADGFHSYDDVYINVPESERPPRS
ncbi:MAG: substrate-binding domain-containing protein [Spirochaetales bacterium]|uniref:Substrate-binding domain-containing protein n=1 Tax=Candidatus Thalassospirochaeta sargassi TaxID=3119039 RepID=A0AAJ1ICN9_9SPIO|nr:substrate-binding domain-containing protein [Spirochaetales bacterium]